MDNTIVFLVLICWKVIYPVDSAIQLLNNQGQMKHYTVDKYNDNNDNNNLHYLMNYRLKNRCLAPVVETLDSPIQWINHYSKDKFYRNQLCYPMDKDLSSG